MWISDCGGSAPQARHCSMVRCTLSQRQAFPGNAHMAGVLFGHQVTCWMGTHCSHCEGEAPSSSQHWHAREARQACGKPHTSTDNNKCIHPLLSAGSFKHLKYINSCNPPESLLHFSNEVTKHRGVERPLQGHTASKSQSMHPGQVFLLQNPHTYPRAMPPP